MNKVIIVVMLAVVSIVGCGSSENDLPSTPIKKLSKTTLADFNFDTDIDYMERRIIHSGESSDDYNITNEFDSQTRAELTEGQLFYLQQAVTSSGIGVACLPSSCSVYFVTLKGEVSNVIDNKLDLTRLMGDIDSPSEIHFVLLQTKYAPIYYKETNTGFDVIASWGNCSGKIGEDLLKIDIFGNVTLVKTIKEKNTDAIC